MSTVSRPDGQRVDAQRNRARILETAYDAFTEDPDVSLNAIAKRAGVGPGTLYRHFPTREALLLSVYEREIAAVGDAVTRSLAEREPLDAFREWARRLAALMRVKHGLGEALSAPAADTLYASSYGPVTRAISDLLDAAEANGDMVARADPDDVLLLLGALWRVPRGDAGITQADRILELIIDGLRGGR
jgi:AcrR family transcriptional regulator